jgi:predicted CoA-binding protein
MNEIIEHIINQKYIAVVGVSDKSMGGEIYKALKQRGYSVYPVHPTRESFLGDKCYPTLRALPSSEIKTAVIAVSPELATPIVDDAAFAGITHLWFQQGKNFADALEAARAVGLKTVSRKCILMYAPPVTGVHSVHRFIAKIFGRM